MPSAEYFLFRILRLLRKLPVDLSRIGNTVTVFSDCFRGFHKVEAVKGIFGDKTEKVLSNLKVELSWIGGYMYVDGSSGHLVVSKSYLNAGSKTDIYLDLIHELYHVKQFMDGKELFDMKYDYVDRPTEIEAYRYTVQEAKRIGLSDEEITKYLKTEWLNAQDLNRLIKNIGFAFQENANA